MSDIKLTGTEIHKEESKYHGNLDTILEGYNTLISQAYLKFLHRLLPRNKNMAPTLLGFKGLKRHKKYLSNHPHKPIFYPYSSYGGYYLTRLTWSGDKLEDYTTHNCLGYNQY